MPRHQLVGWFETISGQWGAQCLCGWSTIGDGDATEHAWQAHWAACSRGR